MAVSPPLHPGYELPGGTNCVTGEMGQRRMQIPIEEPRAPTKGCSIDMIAAKIDSCAKARVFAIILFNLLVFDGQLSKDRSNWSCPFGHCKLNFVDKHELMQHVLDCPDFSSDKVFCNCCRKDDHFEEHCRHNRAEQIASHGTSSKKRNPIRKISNMFSRNRESKGSSPNSEGSVSPVSTHYLRSLITSTPSPSNQSRRGSSPTLQESPRETVEQAHSTRQAAFSESIGSETCESQELPAPEAPCELSGTTTGAHELPSQMFNDIMEMRGSPTEGFHMDSMIPDEDAFRAYDASYIHDMEASNAQLPPANGHDSAFQPQHQEQSAWFMQQQQALLPHFDLQVSPAISQEGLYSTGGPMSDHIGLTNLPPNPQFQQTVSTPDRRLNRSQLRKASGDSGYSDGVSTVVVFEHAPQPDRPGSNEGCIADPASPTSRIVTASSIVAAESVGGRNLRCPYQGCTYSPGGHPRKHAANLKKHINTKHRRSTQVRCSGCGNWYSRSDNLKVHQEGACLRSRCQGALYPAHRPPRRSGAVQRREWGDAWQVE